MKYQGKVESIKNRSADHMPQMESTYWLNKAELAGTGESVEVVVGSVI